MKGPLKDKESRIVPILDALHPILEEWKRRSGGAGCVIPPLRRDGRKVDKHTPGALPARSLEGARPRATRPRVVRGHTPHVAGQWVMAGVSIEKPKEILGHYSVVVTERYACLRPDLFPVRDLGTIAVDMAPEAGDRERTWERNGIQGTKLALQVLGKRAKRSEPPCKPSPVPDQ